VWRGVAVTPVSSVLPREASNIAQGPGGVKSLVRSPLVVAETDTNAWEGTTTNPRCRLLVVICTAVDRGRPKDTLKPSSMGGLGIEGEARCGAAKRF